MKVFISWSGALSKSLADIFRNWLPTVIQAVRPYYSPDDTTKGARWSTEIAKELEEAGIGLICLTRDNLDSSWIMFEAGALSKNIERSKVCPILFNIKPTDVQGPLVQFQLAQFEKSEMKRVIRMINEGVEALGENSLRTEVLEEVFEMWWPRLKEKVEAELLSSHQVTESSLRSERELLEEILKLSRASTNSQFGNTDESIKRKEAVARIVQRFNELLFECEKTNTTESLRDKLLSLREPIQYLVDKSGAASLELQQYMKVTERILMPKPGIVNQVIAYRQEE